jgi:mannose/fructose/N-acetylgalactosamine-specific phosphotransferase system component IIC
MTEFSPAVVLPLLLWGTLVALDLVSVPQAMISRPVVAGTVAGALIGDFEAGLRVGCAPDTVLGSPRNAQPSAAMRPGLRRKHLMIMDDERSRNRRRAMPAGR